MSNSTLYPARLQPIRQAIIVVLACFAAMLLSAAAFLPEAIAAPANAAEASAPQADATPAATATTSSDTLVPQNLSAQETTLPVAPTKCGTCLWSIDSAGKLTIAPEEGDTGTLENWQANPPWKSYQYQITAVDIEGTVIAPTCGSMFASCNNLATVDLDGLDTSQASNMKSMFQGCLVLKSLDVSMLDTSNATTMSGMFAHCQKLTSLDLHTFNTSKVQDMNNMFSACSILTSIDMEGLDTSSVTDMSYMLKYCPATCVEFSKIDTSSVQNMQGMFQESTASALDLTGLNTSSATNMSSMFEGCNKLTSLDISGFDTHSTINMEKMFSGCTRLQTITIGKNWAKLGAANTTDMFTGCNALVGANGTSFAAMQVADGTYARADFADLPGYLTPSADWEEPTEQPIASGTDNTCNWTISADGTLTLSPLEGQEKGALGNFGATVNPPWKNYKSQITAVKVEGEIQATTLTNAFNNCINLTNVDLTGLDTQYAGDFVDAFGGCKKLESIDLSMLDTRALSNAQMMFNNCTSLNSVNLSGWNTSSLRDIDTMFRNCSSLETIDLSSFNTSQVHNFCYIFSGCTSLKTIIVGDGWVVSESADTGQMFTNCNVLVGANGTAYTDKQVADGTYACIDTAATPGYLSPADYTGTDTGNNGNGEGGTENGSGSGSNESGSGNGSGSDNQGGSSTENGGSSNNDSGNSNNSDNNNSSDNSNSGNSGSNSNSNSSNNNASNGSGGNRNNNGNGNSNNSNNASKRISIAKATVKLSKSAYIYDGKAHTPKVTVKLKGKTLKANRDYTVSYAKGRKAIGTYKVTVTGKGSYKGKAYASFKIVLGTPTMTSLDAKINSDGTFGFVASWKKTGAASAAAANATSNTGTAGYQIRWSLSKSFKNAKSYTFDSSSPFAKQHTIALQVKSRSWLGKKAYVQMRTFKTIGKKRYYSSWSTMKTVKLKK